LLSFWPTNLPPPNPSPSPPPKGRPTDSSVTVNLLPADDVELYFEYGTTPGVFTTQTDMLTYPANVVIEVNLDSLQPNTLSFYRKGYPASGGVNFTTSDLHFL
jgi:hypothetical protein